MTERGWDVFVSYGHGDAEWVWVLAANLHRAGFDVFLDEWELVGGDRFAGRLEEGIRGSANGVLVVSPHALSRPWVQEEYAALLRQAVEQPGRRLIPVIYTDAELPVFLASRHWIDFRNPAHYQAKLEELIRALRGLPAADRPARDSSVQSPDELFRPAGPIRATLTISTGQVSLDEASQRPAGLQQSTEKAVKDLQWRRAHPDPYAPPGADDAALHDIGRRLAADFLDGPAGEAVAIRVDEAARLNEVLELGLEVTEPTLSDLPWEALAEPNGNPLALHRNVALYRQIGGLGASPVHKVRGPLRLLVAISSPETGDGELLDYEAELARIVNAVEPARKKGEAYVRVLNEGSLSAIHAALSDDAEGFHVLHLSCHGRPGELILETPDGQSDPVTAERLLDEGVPAGADLPMVVLSGCSTGLANGEATLASFAARLVEAGIPQVLAMQAPVTDRYATALAGELYRYLAANASPDPLLALAEARRTAERDRLALPLESPQRGPAEWATPALITRGLRLPLFNRREPFGEVRPLEAPVLAEGVVVREVGDFVGRRRELRVARRALAGKKAGLILHGIGGVGKSTLAAEVLRSLDLVVSKAGQVSVDDILTPSAPGSRREPSWPALPAARKRPDGPEWVPPGVGGIPGGSAGLGLPGRYVWAAEVQLFAADVEALTAAVAAQAVKPEGLLVRTVSLR